MVLTPIVQGSTILEHVKSVLENFRRKRSALLTEMDAFYSELQHERLQQEALFIYSSQFPHPQALLNHFYSLTHSLVYSYFDLANIYFTAYLSQVVGVGKFEYCF